MSTGAIVGIVIGGVVLLLILSLIIWCISTYNKFIKMKNNIEEAYSTMDVYLKKRYDLIPNLVETVKGYAKHEKETLEKVMEARYSAMNANAPEDKIAKDNILSGTLKTLFSVSENYPQLKADKNFNNLSESLNKIEEDILNSRKYYNGSVKMYNTRREVFPSSIIARIFKFDKKPLYEVEDVQERKNVKVQF